MHIRCKLQTALHAPTSPNGLHHYRDVGGSSGLSMSPPMSTRLVRVSRLALPASLVVASGWGWNCVRIGGNWKGSGGGARVAGGSSLLGTWYDDGPGP